MTDPAQPPADWVRSRRGECIALAFISAVAIALRFLTLGKESLWFDEGWTWWLTGLPPGKMFDVIRGDVVAPLSFYLLKAWRVCVGDVNEAGLRMPSAVYATLTLVPFYRLVRATLRTRVARIVACALMACSFMQLQYTREARPYALLCLMTISALACVPTLARRRSWPALIGFAVFAAGGLYTHNMMLFYGVALGIAWLAWPGERSLDSRLVDMLIAGAIVAVLVGPWLPIMGQQARSMSGTFWAAVPGWAAVREALPAISGVDVYGVPSAGWVVFGRSITAELTGVIAVIGVLLASIVAFLEPGRRRVAAAIIGFALGPFVLVFLISQVAQPVFMERAFISSSAILPILFALPLDGRSRAVKSIGGAVLLLLGTFAITSAITLFAFQQKEDWRAAYQYVVALPPSKTRAIVFVANEGELPFDFYLRNEADKPREAGAPHGFFGPYPPRTIQQVKTDADLNDVRAEIARGATEIVLVLSHDNFSDPAGLTETFLDSHCDRVEERALRGVRVVRYAVARATSP